MKSILFVLCICSLFVLTAQENTGLKIKEKSSEKRMNTFFVEFGGPGLIYSINYDVRFLKSHVGPGIRIGGGGMAVGGWNFYAIPVGLNYLIGKGSHTLELGAGATITNLTKSFSSNTATVIGNGVIGYRTQPSDGGFSLRLGLTPFFGVESGSFYFIPFGGASFGWVF